MKSRIVRSVWTPTACAPRSITWWVSFSPATNCPAIRRDCDSQYLEDAVHGTVGPAMAYPHRHDAIQPVVFRRRRFEQRNGPEIIAGGIHGFAPLQPGDDIGGAVTHAAIRHRY